jgi:hypothetical protein
VGGTHFGVVWAIPVDNVGVLALLCVAILAAYASPRGLIASRLRPRVSLVWRDAVARLLVLLLLLLLLLLLGVALVQGRIFLLGVLEDLAAGD